MLISMWYVACCLEPTSGPFKDEGIENVVTFHLDIAVASSGEKVPSYYGVDNSRSSEASSGCVTD